MERYRGLCACGDHAWAVLTRGYITTVSPEDATLIEERMWSALRTKGKFYAVRTGPRPNRSMFLLHREIAVAERVDHRDGNGLDNRRGNLRPATHADNMRNSKMFVTNTSGFKGVVRSRDRWAAYIQNTYLGVFDSKIEAAHAYDAQAIARYGEFARPNFPRTP